MIANVGEAAAAALAASPGSLAETTAVLNIVQHLRGPVGSRIVGENYIMLAALFTHREEEGWARAHDMPICEWRTLEAMCARVSGSFPTSLPPRDVLIRALERAVDEAPRTLF